MPFSPRDPKSIEKLKVGLKQSQQEMEIAYKNRLKAYQEMMGAHSPYANARKRPINLLELAATIYKQKLVPTGPRASVQAKNINLTAPAASFELALDAVLSQEGVPDEIEAAIVEAMFSPLGIVKTYIPNDRMVNIDGQLVPGGMPKINAVTFDHWVQDMSANGPASVSFCGDKYYLERDEAMRLGYLDPDLIAKIPKDDRDRPADWETQSMREFKHYEDYRDMLELWDIWLPEEGLILTFSGDFGELPPLRTEEWTGGEGEKDGPYERLWFGIAPGCSLPPPPVAFWLDLHRLANILFLKLAAQAERQKTNDAVESSNPEDGDKLRTAKDGEFLSLTSLNKVKTLRAGGPDNANFAFFLQNKELFSYMAGNLDALAGLGAMSGTVGQDELLTQGASDRLRFMQERVTNFLRRLCIKLGRYLWNSTLVDIPIQKMSAGTAIPSVWNRDLMPGEFPDYLLSINPHSLQNRSPSEKLMQLQMFWQQFVLPAAPVMQALGAMPNYEAFVKEYSRLADMPELNSLIIYSQGEMLPSMEPSAPPKAAAPASNRSTKTAQGQTASMISELMSKGPTQQNSTTNE